MRIAVIADIHGNAPALREVLNDLSRYSIDRIVNLGDAFNGPIDPSGVARLLRDQQIVHVRGNGERMVLSDNPAERSRSADFARGRLAAAEVEWIRTWPKVYQEAEYFACHGSPDSDVEYLLEEVIDEGARLRTAEDIGGRLTSIGWSLLLCAHTHIPRFVRVGVHRSILNPGSVGLPAYSDSAPTPHKMEVGSPHARYAIAESVSSGWKVSHIAIPYDYEMAATRAEYEGFPDWAKSIRTGYAPQVDLA